MRVLTSFLLGVANTIGSRRVAEDGDSVYARASLAPVKGAATGSRVLSGAILLGVLLALAVNAVPVLAELRAAGFLIDSMGIQELTSAKMTNYNALIFPEFPMTDAMLRPSEQ